MRITGYIWLEHIIEKLITKHDVSQEEVREVFSASPHYRRLEKGHRRGEDVYVAFGQSDAGRYLAVFFVLKKGGQALILSARDMSQSERRLYERA